MGGGAPLATKSVHINYHLKAEQNRKSGMQNRKKMANGALKKEDVKM